MMVVAVTGSIADLSHSRITTAEWHLWHTMRRSDGSRTGLGDICRVLGRRRVGKSRRYRRRRGRVKPAQFLFNSLALPLLPSSGFLMLGESPMKNLPMLVAALAMPFLVPRCH